MKARLLALSFMAALVSFTPPALAQERAVEGRVIFAKARDIPDAPAAGKLVKDAHDAGFNVLVLSVKQPDGKIYFRSKKFGAACASTVKDFDPLAAVLKAAHKEGLTVHAGLCAFLEGPNSPSVDDYPEWAVRNPAGKTTRDVKRTRGIWMCPARRPGYADRYLIPMIKELLENYKVDGIHLDHLSFPVEAGSNRYCFCEHCLSQFPRDSRLYYPTLAKDRFASSGGHANPSPAPLGGGTALPAGYGSRARKAKVKYMLEGSYFEQGPADMDYFFYSYRTDAIRSFCSALYKRAREVSPRIELSARCGWNAPAAGRFAGQRWTDFGQWFDFLVLDMGRDHLPGDFATYRKLLGGAVSYMAYKSRNIAHTCVGLSVEGIYLEETRALEAMLEALESLERNPRGNMLSAADKLAAQFEKVKANLTAADEMLANHLKASIISIKTAAATKSPRPKRFYTDIKTRVQQFLKEPPAGFFAPKKMAEILKTVRGAGANSLALDGVAAIGHAGLWEKLPELLGGPAREPYQVRPLRAPSAQIVRLLFEKQEQLANASAEIELLNQQLKEVSAEIAPLRGRVEKSGQSGKDKVDKLDSLLSKLDELRREYSRKIAELQELATSKPAQGQPSPASPTEPPQPEGTLTDAHYETLQRLLDEKTRQLEIAQKARDAAEKLALELTAKSHQLESDADYSTLRRMVEEKTGQLEIAEKQRDAAEKLALHLTTEFRELESQLIEQKQEYFYYISMLIALACLGLTVVLVMSLIKRRR